MSLMRFAIYLMVLFFSIYEPGLFFRNPHDPEFSQTGLFGDPTKATAEKGKKALAILTRQWLLSLRGFADTPLRTDESHTR